ncbi:serine/threonine-protein kinase STY46 isoform X2 [Cajanus cajan]|uniref:serine/threonine-protein kinase STY46 isoform X2 n=1 Tax=Cajanus cajan TaxID=3821 RepID=UPI0010FB7435|nr:serine/threonine-protein kinase STY46 isoform X2 [Cajanus cajan]
MVNSWISSGGIIHVDRVVDSESKNIYMGDTESCSSGIFNSGWNQCPKQKHKVGVYNEVLCRLKELNVAEAVVPGFEDELWAHFYRLPTRYALDMNVERAQDVLMHKRLLDIARAPTTATGPAVQVRLVQIGSTAADRSSKSFLSHSQSKVCPEDSGIPGNMSFHPLPAFGSSANVELTLGKRQLQVRDRDNYLNFYAHYAGPMHEITISTNDKPKLLCQLTSLLSETGLDIQEAHAFSTIDGYSLDVFVVGGWVVEGTEKLKHELVKKIQKLQDIWKQLQLKENGSLITAKQEQTRMNFIWRIGAGCLRYEKIIASGPFSDLYKGTFCNQDVAIKVLKHENFNENIQREFAQEVYILSKIHHKNVVKFVGACTKPPNLYLVTEYMSGGSMFDFLHKQKTVLDLPSLLKVAIDVSEGMKYLHQNDIIHRDLKAANLLIDENWVVKVADFGVARVHNQSGIMTAETGTYRWMAPEVIEHKPYDHKVDVFSFGIVLWELLTGKLPYEHLSPMQAAIGVMQKGLRPRIPRHTHPKLVELLHWCWHQDPSSRPNFSEILDFLLHVTKTICRGESEQILCHIKKKN